MLRYYQSYDKLKPHDGCKKLCHRLGFVSVLTHTTGQFYWWRKPDKPEKIRTNLSQVTDKLQRRSCIYAVTPWRAHRQVKKKKINKKNLLLILTV
jgi:hypothetical protein